MKRLFLLVVLGGLMSALSQPAEAANHYIRAGAGGSGADWASACSDFTGSCATPVRGDTYYVAGGSYGGRTFSTANSGTAAITIKGATAADHGTDVGWNAGYGVDISQAKFGGLTFTTSYWVFDGVVGPVWSRNLTAYGFNFPATSYAIQIHNDNTAITNITIAHISALAPSGDVEKFFVSTSNTTQSVSNVTISNVYLDGWQNAYWATEPGNSPMDNWIFQYGLCTNGFSSPAHHGEWINNNYGYMTNQITRFSWFENTADMTGVIVANNNDNVNAQVYGNVFYNLNVANGVVTGTSQGNLISPHVYNNTFVKAGSSGGWMGDHVSGSPVVENNLLYNMSASKQVTSGTDYNSYFKTTNTPSETHGYVSSIDPFVNSGALDFHLIVETTSGITLTAPYDVDVDGNGRPGPDAVWSRGAYQYGGTVSSRPQPPTNVQASVN